MECRESNNYFSVLYYSKPFIHLFFLGNVTTTFTFDHISYAFCHTSKEFLNFMLIIYYTVEMKTRMYVSFILVIESLYSLYRSGGTSDVVIRLSVLYFCGFVETFLTTFFLTVSILSLTDTNISVCVDVQGVECYPYLGRIRLLLGSVFK